MIFLCTFVDFFEAFNCGTNYIFSLVLLNREKDEDEGIPSETEDDKRQLESKAKEMRGDMKTSNWDQFAFRITCLSRPHPFISLSVGQIC